MTSTYSNTSADQAIAALLADGAKVRTEREGRYVPAVVNVREGSTTYQFQRAVDRKWRLTSVNTYGNYQGVTGHGCDASGYVITDRYVADELTMIYNTH